MPTSSEILFVIDPLRKLDWEWDNSLALLREFSSRGRRTWICDVPDLFARDQNIFALCRQVRSPSTLTLGNPVQTPIRDFNLVVFRKEPPFNQNFLCATYLLEIAARIVPVSNHPAGIRNLNEKLSSLGFAPWIPKTIVTSNPDLIFEFQKKLGRDIVVKPLDQKGGRGIFRILQKGSGKKKLMRLATQHGRQFVLAQAFIQKKQEGEKRIVLLNGDFLTAYEKRPDAGEFRGNLGLGGTWHTTHLSRKEKKLILALKPYLRSEGIHLAGIDTLEEKLLEINVTCPAGIREASALHPQLEPVKTWADFLERLCRKRRPK